MEAALNLARLVAPNDFEVFSSSKDWPGRILSICSLLESLVPAWDLFADKTSFTWVLLNQSSSEDCALFCNNPKCKWGTLLATPIAPIGCPALIPILDLLATPSDNEDKCVP